MKVNKKSLLISSAILGSIAVLAVPITIIAISNDSVKKNEQDLIKSPIVSISGQVNENMSNSPQKEEGTQLGFKIEHLKNTINIDSIEQYKITIINDDKYGILTFEDGLDTKIVTPGEKIKLKVQIKDEYKSSYTVVNLSVFDELNPNYSLGITKLDENNYEFIMPDGGDEGKWFYQSGNIFAKITYGLKKIGQWEFDFRSKHYVLNITEDDFIYDDIENPELKIKQYPTGEFVVYRIQMNNHNIKIKNMTIPKNVQFEICNTYDDGYETTDNSPVLGVVNRGKGIVQEGAAGIWRGVRATFWASSAFGWGLNSYADSKYDAD